MTTNRPSIDISRSLQGRDAFWWAHARWPLICFLVLATLLESTSIDRMIAHAWYYDDARGLWMGGKETWSNTVLHIGAARAVRAIALLIVLIWIGSFLSSTLQAWRRTTAFLIVAITLSVGLVGLLKQLTNVDCPWDLEEFGGNFPYVPLFGDRPNGLRSAHCFPAAHASSGFALVAFYFVLLERRRRWATPALWISTLTGVAFGIAQQARGAHFLSHDVFSAFLVWITSLTVYVYGFNCNARTASDTWQGANARAD